MPGAHEANFPVEASSLHETARSSNENILGDLTVGKQSAPGNEIEPFPQFYTTQQILISSIFYHAQDAILSITLGTIYTPFDRVATLLTVEGELRRQHILPMKTGFGGIRQCWRQLWHREGLIGCLRSSMWTPLLRFPSRLLVDLFSHAFCRYILLRYRIDPSVVMAMAMVASVMVMAPFNIWQRTIRTVYRADLKTVVASSSDEGKQKKVSFSSDNIETQEKKRLGHSWFRRVFFGRSDVQYHFPHLLSIAVQLGQRLRHWKLAASFVLLEMVYKNTFTWGYPILLFTIPAIGNSIIGRGVCLIVRDVTIQPFRVVMGRLAVSAILSPRDSMPLVTEDSTPTTEKGGTEEELEVPKEEAELPRPPMYCSAWDCASTIIREDGIRGLWAGLRYRLLLTSMAWVNSIVVPPAVDGAY